MNKIVWVILVLSMFSGVALAKDYKEGTDYLKVKQQTTESGSKIEVLEFFWYGCPHCYKFEPVLSSWIKKLPSNVKFIRVPAIFRPAWKVHARTYYSLQVMGLGEKLHEEMFKEMHKKKNKLNSKELMIKFVASHGVDEKVFTDTYSSFPIDNMVRKAIKKIEAYNIRGVPAMAVNGKYVVTGKTAGSHEKMVKVVGHLINKESKAVTSKTKK